MKCAVPGCDLPRNTREWCSGHYQRWRKHGDVMADTPIAGGGAPRLQPRGSISLVIRPDWSPRQAHQLANLAAAAERGMPLREYERRHAQITKGG